MKQIFSMCLDQDSKHIDYVANVLKSLVSEGVISINEIEKGFSRIRSEISDLLIDVPNARELFDAILKLYNS